VVDLRAAGFGNRYVLAAADALTKEGAIHAAYARLAALRHDGAADLPQRSMFDELAPHGLGALIDRWAAQHKPASGSAGAKRYLATYARLVRGDVGHYKVEDFQPPDGTRRLAAYVADLERRRLSGRTIRNRLSILEQALRFAVERGWLSHEPLHPRMPPKAPPVFRWITEAMFRALRGAVFDGVTVGEMHRAGVRDAGELALYVERRRVFLSWLFYTGVHHHDADAATADWLFLDGRAYIRHNNKSARCVADEQFEMPEPLYADLRALEVLQGRPFFPGEPFNGGAWPECSRAMQKAALRLRFPHGANPSILRRSYAREMFLLGYSVREVADRMGHVDERMLHEIYVRTPRPRGRVQSRWAIAADAGAPPTPSGMARVLQMPGSGGRDR
jgi:integrase